MERFNSVIRRVARRHDVVLMEGFDHPAATARETYAADGFHPSPEGHRAAAREFLRALRKRLRPRTRTA
jgi:lysophospholipase L1-like esterase